MRKKKELTAVMNEEKDLLKFLLTIDLFRDLSKLERKNLIKYIYLRQYRKGEIIFKKGYPNVVMYIVREGRLRVMLSDSDDLEMNILKPKDFFGEIGLFLEESRTATVEAQEDSVLLAISKRDLSTFIARFPRAGVKILYRLGEILSQNLIKTNQTITH
ncbi:MAG: cyclic nucleotide-binding domain-containing protein [Candidatus Cloacimonetes bacterium]|nr:cyclic nucleotide-binding domain-containing protein [Candidatus Cloacimonadota bacterium]